MVALAILATALAALVTTAGSQAGNASYLQEKTFAHWVAKNELARLRLAQRQPGADRSLRTSGSSELASQIWYWRTDVSSSADQSVRQITVSIFAEAEDETPLETLEGFLPLVPQTP